MTTILDERTEVSDISLLDFDYAEPCEGAKVGGDKCPFSAKYVCMIIKCGCKFLLCEDCLFYIVNYIKKNDGAAIQCSKCANETVLAPGYMKVIGRV
jgi:hypothetical protein